MRRLFTADIHLSLYQNDKIKNNLPSRLYDIFNSLNQICIYARNNNIQDIDIGGDLFNDKNLVHTRPFVLFSEFLLNNKDLNFTIISGNHDMDSTSDDQVSLIKTIQGYSNVNAITQNKIIDNITYIPFTKNIKQEINNAEPNDILISHFGLNEGMLSSGISMIADVGIKELTKFKLVLLGHYHKAQELQSKNTYLYYVGSPFQKDWGEKHQLKRFIDYNTETLEVKSIDLLGYTKHIELEINDKKEAKDILEQYNKLKEEGHNVRIFNKTDQDIVNEGVYIIEDKEVDVTNRGITISMKLEEQLKKYLEIKQISEEEQNDYLTIGRQLCS